MKDNLQKNATDKRMKSRVTAVFYLTFWVFVILSLRLFQVQVVQAGRFEKLADMEHDEKVSIPAVRGSIYDSRGELLAISTTGYSVAAEPDKISDKEGTAESLAPVLKMAPRDIESLLDSPGGFVWISRKISPDEVEKVREMDLSGVEVVEEPTGKRIYPRGKLACHVLGYTGVDEQGLDGVELYYDKELRGSPGYYQASIDGLGRVMPDGISKLTPAVSGADITLTLDESLQYLAERELENCVKSRHAKSGSIIIMDPNTGAILALASYPNFDGNHYADYPESALRDRAISDDYEPGSTFKSVLAAAALDSGKITMDEKFLSSPAIEVDGWGIRNAEDGLMPVAPMCDVKEIMKDSLNVGAASIGLKIGAPTLWEMIQRMGFTKTTGIDLPGEAQALIPDPKSWAPVQLATISFGQGIAVTPIQMAAAYSLIANGGYPVRPHLVQKIVFPDGTVTQEPSSRGDQPVLRPETDQDLKYLLSLVVKSGTGTTAAIPSYTVAGKTGTAQVDRNGQYLSGQYIASFIGFAPAENPAFVMLVKIDQPRWPYWGGTVSAPLFKDIGSELLWRYQIPPSEGMTRVGPLEVWGEEQGNKIRKLN